MALRAFATLGYDGVVLRTLNRELGGSHNLLNGRFGSKEALLVRHGRLGVSAPGDAVGDRV